MNFRLFHQLDKYWTYIWVEFNAWRYILYHDAKRKIHKCNKLCHTCQIYLNIETLCDCISQFVCILTQFWCWVVAFCILSWVWLSFSVAFVCILSWVWLLLSVAIVCVDRMRQCGEDLLVDMSEALFNELAFFKLMEGLGEPASYSGDEYCSSATQVSNRLIWGSGPRKFSPTLVS